jgi:hypothetical protein
MATTDPYALLEETKNKNLNVVNAQQQQQEISTQKRERQYYDALTAQNRGLNISYKQATNPFGKNSEQRGVLGSGVSDYFKNAAYGNLIMGIGQAQQAYQESLSANQSSWGDFLLKMAGLRTDAENQYSTGVINQRNTDAQLELQQRQQAFDEQRYADSLNAATGGSSGGDGSDGTVLKAPVLTQQAGMGGGGVSAGNYTYTPRTVSSPGAQARAASLNKSVASGGVRKTNPYKVYNYNNYVPRTALR